MLDNGFEVTNINTANLLDIKVKYSIPADLYACHTAIVDGYIIEGHVPAEDINRLLSLNPEIIGISVPGMVSGTPGMESPNTVSQPYDVIAFDALGNSYIFASYP